MPDPTDIVSPSTQTGATEPEVTLPPEQDPSPETAPPVENPGDDTGLAEPASGSHLTRGQARIEELTAEKLALRDAADYWRQRALAQPDAPAPAPVQEKQPPKFADYETADEWAAAHAAFVEERAETRATAAAQTRLETDRKSADDSAKLTAFQEREKAFEKTTKGYREAVSNPSLARFATPTIGEVIRESEIGPAISHHLALNPDKLARIARLTPAQQAVSLGRLEAELASKAAPAPPKVSTRAPAPPTPVGNSAATKDMSEMSIDEYLAHRNRGRKVI